MVLWEQKRLKIILELTHRITPLEPGVFATENLSKTSASAVVTFNSSQMSWVQLGTEQSKLVQGSDGHLYLVIFDVVIFSGVAHPSDDVKVHELNTKFKK